MLVNVDNGGTLTDICLIDGRVVHRTKVLTTPHDLSECFFDGLRQISREVYGDEDLDRLLHDVEHVRYSTTQGTNALVQRKGPRLGLIVADGADVASLAKAGGELFEALVGDRIATIAAGDEEMLERSAIAAVNELTAAGAARLVVSLADAAAEADIERIVLKRFPRQMLGAVPLLPSWRLADDPCFVRRTWSSLFNAFLHPAMERFLYLAERRLRASRLRNPLLVFRNDGGASRVAKTVALKTYSSGPRGGMEGVRALAAHYGFERAVSFDVGGTTTDIGVVEGGRIRSSEHGAVERVPVSFALADVESAGVGGSSIIKVIDGCLKVGPLSVGSAPGPACFGRGGTEVTITDVLLLKGLLDPATFLNGTLRLSPERVQSVVEDKIARPLKVSLDTALDLAEDAWVTAVAQAIQREAEIDRRVTLIAFGGGGPLLGTAVADSLKAKRVLLPALAPVFSAFGIGFSHVSHVYRRVLGSADQSRFEALVHELHARAERDMFGEGAAMESCTAEVVVFTNDRRVVFRGGQERLPSDLVGHDVTVELTVIKPTPQAAFTDNQADASRAVPIMGHRAVRVGGQLLELPLVDATRLQPGATATGPLVLEDPFSTALVGEGWQLEVLGGGDILLSRGS